MNSGLVSRSAKSARDDPSAVASRFAGVRALGLETLMTVAQQSFNAGAMRSDRLAKVSREIRCCLARLEIIPQFRIDVP